MVLEVTSRGRVVGTVEPLEDGRYKTKITGVKTSQPSQVFKGREVLVDYLDWLTDGEWSAEGGEL